MFAPLPAATSPPVATTAVLPRSAMRATPATTSGSASMATLRAISAVNVSRADKVTDGGRFTSSISNVRFDEWDFTADTAVAGGQCYVVSTSNLDVSWANPGDGGAIEIFQGDGGPP